MTHTVPQNIQASIELKQGLGLPHFQTLELFFFYEVLNNTFVTIFCELCNVPKKDCCCLISRIFGKSCNTPVRQSYVIISSSSWPCSFPSTRTAPLLFVLLWEQFQLSKTKYLACQQVQQILSGCKNCCCSKNSLLAHCVKQ